ncbi:PKD domain-containing protein [Halorussus caseinilyticus]|uniref:PKD domain-containing protein n=1 Tax=Halorussus caseinilyticus TaxID=3034025 RepID=A0ABD5WGK0_9EURY|nr:PKD domain-containing protein [Halorussus sp. DT72]
MVDQPDVRTSGRTLLQTTESADADAASGAVRNRSNVAVRHGPSVPVVDTPVLFEVELPADESDCRCEWTFGDGSTATGEKASRIYDAAGETEVTLTVARDDGETETVRESVTIYREVGVELRESETEDGLMPVVLRGDGDLDPATAVAVESLRFGAPTALAMGSGAAPVRTETREGDLCVWVREDRTGLGDGDATPRLAGRTVDGRPLAGTADGA